MARDDQRKDTKRAKLLAQGKVPPEPELEPEVPVDRPKATAKKSYAATRRSSRRAATAGGLSASSSSRANSNQVTAATKRKKPKGATTSTRLRAYHRTLYSTTYLLVVVHAE